jgi:nitrate/nitrite-specific signal transduction histidine kinase
MNGMLVGFGTTRKEEKRQKTDARMRSEYKNAVDQFPEKMDQFLAILHQVSRSRRTLLLSCSLSFSSIGTR